MAILLPVGIESRDGISGQGLLKPLGQFLFVNPEKMSVNRMARIGDARTMGGTVFQPWPNAPDELTFEGTLYGLRSLYDIMVLSDAINSSPDSKEINLIYKWRKFPGLVRSLSIVGDAGRPRQLTYTMTIVLRDAMELHRMLIGQLTGAAVERSFVNAQVSGAKQSVQGLALNNLLTVALIGSGGFTKDLGKKVMWRALAMIAYGAVFNIGRGKGWAKL